MTYIHSEQFCHTVKAALYRY